MNGRTFFPGSITLTDAAGFIFHFKRGDTFVVSLGTIYGWQCAGYFRAVRCAFQPRALAWISQTGGCIGAENLRKLLCSNNFSVIPGAPRCRQSVRDAVRI